MKAVSSRKHRAVKFCLKCGACIIAVSLLVLLYLSTVGFPRAAVSRLNSSLSRGNYVVDAKKVRIDLLEGLVFKQVTVFEKRVVGPPVVEAGKMLVCFSPLAAGKSYVTGIEISDGVIRPGQAVGGRDNGAQRGDLRLNVGLRACVIEGVTIVEGSGCLLTDRDRIIVTNMYAVVGSSAKNNGTLCGCITVNTTDKIVLGQLDTGFDPNCLAGLMQKYNMPGTLAFTRCLAWKSGGPVVHTDFTMALGGTGDYRSYSTFAMENFSYRGITNSRCQGGVLVDFWGTNSTIAVGPFHLARNEGSFDGKFTILIGRQLTVFDAESSIDPKSLFRMLDLFTEEKMKNWKFDGPVRVAASGTADLKAWDRTDFKAVVEGRKMGIDPFMTEKCSFTMTVNGITNSVTDIEGEAYGGIFGGKALFYMPDGGVTNTRYRIEGWAKDASFARVARMFAHDGKHDYDGKLKGSLAVEGVLEDSDFSLMRGSGEVEIRKGKVFMLPVFGRLSEFMTKIIPGLNFVLRQSDAKAAFTITNRTVHSDKVKIEGDVLSLEADGDYKFDGSLNYKVEIKLMKDHVLLAKLLRLITYPISKLLEFRLQGTMEKPDWYPINFSGELLERIGLKNGSRDKQEHPKGATPENQQ